MLEANSHIFQLVVFSPEITVARMLITQVRIGLESEVAGVGLGAPLLLQEHIREGAPGLWYSVLDVNLDFILFLVSTFELFFLLNLGANFKVFGFFANLNLYWLIVFRFWRLLNLVGDFLDQLIYGFNYW